MGKGATRPVRETAHCCKSKPLNFKGMGRRDLESLLMPVEPLNEWLRIVTWIVPEQTPGAALAK